MQLFTVWQEGSNRFAFHSFCSKWSNRLRGAELSLGAPLDKGISLWTNTAAALEADQDRNPLTEHTQNQDLHTLPTTSTDFLCCIKVCDLK